MKEELSFRFRGCCLVEIINLRVIISEESGRGEFVVEVVFKEENQWGLVSVEIEIPSKRYDQVNFIIDVEKQLEYYISRIERRKEKEKEKDLYLRKLLKLGEEVKATVGLTRSTNEEATTA